METNESTIRQNSIVHILLQIYIYIYIYDTRDTRKTIGPFYNREN